MTTHMPTQVKTRGGETQEEKNRDIPKYLSKKKKIR